MADLPATVITTYAAVIAGNGEAAAAGLEQITAQAGAPAVRPRPWQRLPGPVRSGHGGDGRPVRAAPLAALCTALECSPNDLFEVDTPVEQPVRPPQPTAEPKTVSSGGRSMPPL
ncbi:helix-turn-helix domain-containing protein [Sphaerisporangium sp. NPDC049003]|uniref:helix-turn-helix domain-containing protein n=1 Tax=Sphaerisporangium sp. NPDC049003 TaxID=3364517 RepID=UPI003710D595